MSEAPERPVEPSDPERAEWSDVTREYVEYLEWCEDHVLALVAAEREACARLVGSMFAPGSEEEVTCDVAADNIRARGNTDALAQRDARIRAEARRVKPLEWEYHPAGAIAAPPTGHAYIIDTIMKGRVYSLKGFNLQREFASVNEAKAAAQADYERRILPALMDDDT